MGNLITRCRPDLSVRPFMPPQFSVLLCLFLLMSTKLCGQNFQRVFEEPFTIDRDGSMGVGWGDFDQDGYLDLYVVNTVRKASDLDDRDYDVPNYLYRNNRNSTFAKITIGEIVSDTAHSVACSWGDYDNDGDLDLFVANGRNSFLDIVYANNLYRNNGDGMFTKITEGEIVTEKSDSRSCSWADYDNDGYLDLFVTNASGRNNFLYKNNRDGTFTKITTGIIVSEGGNSRGCGWADYDNDGDLDLFVANGDNQNNFLYNNNGDGAFTKITTGEVVTDGGDSQGCSWGDYDNDGALDLFVANAGYQNNFLYHNNGDGTFTKVTAGPIVNDEGDSRGSGWGDYDNDGDLDLVVVNYIQNSFLYTNNGDGAFSKITSGPVVEDPRDSQGCAWADYDRDGDLDLFVANYSFTDIGLNFLYKNLANDNNASRKHWINIECVGINSNRSAIGAKVHVKARINGNALWQMQEISGQTGYGGQNSLQAEFGLGDAIVVDTIKVEWPSRQISVLANIPANRFFKIEEADVPPAPPQNLEASAEVGKIILKWDANSEYDLLLYFIYGDTTVHPTTRIHSSLANNLDREWVNTKVIAGKQYYFRITAIDQAFHESSYSMEVSATVPKMFMRVTTGPVVADTAFTTGSSWADYDNDGDQDLYVTNAALHMFLPVPVVPGNNFFMRTSGAAASKKFSIVPLSKRKEYPAQAPGETMTMTDMWICLWRMPMPRIPIETIGPIFCFIMWMGHLLKLIAAYLKMKVIIRSAAVGSIMITTAIWIYSLPLPITRRNTICFIAIWGTEASRKLMILSW